MPETEYDLRQWKKIRSTQKAQYKRVTRSIGLEIYFTDPFASWQNGTNENTNDLLRQVVSKGAYFTQVNHHEVARVEQ